jgi:hypothetical protein
MREGKDFDRTLFCFSRRLDNIGTLQDILSAVFSVIMLTTYVLPSREGCL